MFLQLLNLLRLKQEHVLFSTDGPHRNVLKFKPPMCFNIENADELLDKVDMIMTEIESGTSAKKITSDTL